MSSETLTREQALLRLHDHFGEQVYLGLQATVPATDDAPPAHIGVIELHGELSHPLGLEDSSDMPGETRDIFGALYKIGDQAFVLPALPGRITENADGLDFELTAGLTLRIAWQSSSHGS